MKSSMSGEKNMEGRHVGLDFYDLLIEARASHKGEPLLAGRQAFYATVANRDFTQNAPVWVLRWDEKVDPRSRMALSYQ